MRLTYLGATVGMLTGLETDFPLRETGGLHFRLGLGAVGGLTFFILVSLA